MTMSLLAKTALAVTAAAPMAGATFAQTAAETAASNPVRKVVTMLQQMQSKVQQEGELSEELFKKMECYCKTSGKDLTAGIQRLTENVAALGPEIEGATERKVKTEEDVKAHQADREAAKTAMAEASSIRDKEKATFDAFFSESQTNVAALGKAIAAVEHGMAGGFLQTPGAVVLRTFVASSKAVMDADRQTLLAFLSGKGEYAPQSGEISGILQTIHDEMAAEQKDAVATEDAAVKAYGELTVAKKKEVAALSKAIEEKLARIGQLGVEIASMTNDLGDSVASLEEDKAFLGDLEKTCSSHAEVHEQEKKLRSEELVALADTIKILNDDDALDLFKKTLPSASASLMQVQTSVTAQRASALKIVSKIRDLTQVSDGRNRLDIVMLALSGKKVGFEKIIVMVDELIATLKTEQAVDDGKEEYCRVQFDQTDDKKKVAERALADLVTLMAEAQDGIATTEEEIAAFSHGIAELDKNVAAATEQRKAENVEYKDLMASNGAAKELLLFAKNRLSKFYNPANYKEAPKQELSREDRIAVNNGGAPPPTEAPGGIAGTGISVSFVQIASGSKEAPPPPPAAAEAYKAKGEESNGVMAMIDLLVQDLQKEMMVAEAEEKNAQENYEQAMKDSAEKRAMDSKSLADREGARADLQAELERSKGEHESGTKDLGALESYISSLHAECDWLLKYFDVRKQARSDEIDALGAAKAVLSGADFALMQRSNLRARKFLRH